MISTLKKLIKRDTDTHGYYQETRDLLRGVTGGLIFGIPLLYTMEVWFQGQVFSSGALLIILISMLFLNMGFSFLAGVRENHLEGKLFDAIDDGVTALGISLCLSAIVLLLIGRINFDDDPITTLSKIVLEACIISVGVSFTNFKVKNKKHHLIEKSKLASPKNILSTTSLQSRKDIYDFIAAAIGAFAFSFNVAPTEEIILISSQLSPLNLCLLIIVEVLVCYIVLYGSGIKTHIVYESQSFFQRPMIEVLLTTSISLLVSFALLGTFGFDLHFDDFNSLIPSIIVLNFPAVVGGAAGRLAI